MSFLGVYKAIYAYTSQSPEELSIKEDDILYLLETSDIDEWWKVKKRVVGSDLDEPIGLVPKTYIEPADIINSCVALYDYDKQTSEELSFKENDTFNVYDTSDIDWYLVSTKTSNPSRLEYGFIPSNYIQLTNESPNNKNTNIATTTSAASFPAPPTHPTRQPQPQEIQPSKKQYQHISDDDDDDDENDQPPPTPKRPTNPDILRSPSPSTSTSRPIKKLSTATSSSNNKKDKERLNYNPRRMQNSDSDDNSKESDEFFTWNVAEVEGRKKKKAQLGIGNGVIYFRPDPSTGDLPQKWNALNLVNFSTEKKHVFLDFKNPSASIEIHAGSREIADEILELLADIRGAVSSKGLKEVKAASKPTANGYKVGKVLYDFKAQDLNELNVKENDLVFIINDKKSKDWWLVKNIDNNKEGVVPASYIEINSSNFSLGSVADKTRNLVKSKSNKRNKEKEFKLREREERERKQRDNEREREREKKQRDYEKRKKEKEAKEKTKPNSNKVRTWVDKTGSFNVDAEFLGISQGKVHLHKVNGVKIAVAAEKLALADIEYVERVTGTSLDAYKPDKERQRDKDDEKRRKEIEKRQREKREREEYERSKSVITAAKNLSANQKKSPSYDWFEFFLECGVDVNICQRYALSFEREQMDENSLEDITPSLLRTLGFKEGDNIRVLKFLDKKFNRQKPNSAGSNTSEALFVGSGGELKNNRTRSTSNVAIDASALQAIKQQNQPSVSTESSTSKSVGGFDDDAWTVKPASKSNSQIQNNNNTPDFTGSLQDLVDLKPLEATNGNSTASAISPIKSTKPIVPVLQPSKTGSSLKSQKTSSSIRSQRTGNLIPLDPFKTGGNLVPFATGGAAMILPLQTGMMMPMQPVLIPQTTTTFAIQKTGGGMPQTSFIIPQTTFGTSATTLVPVQRTGGFVQMTTGGLIPLQKTGGTVTGMPQTSFVTSMPTSSFTGSTASSGVTFPTTSFAGSSFIAPSQPVNPQPQTGFENMFANMNINNQTGFNQFPTTFNQPNISQTGFNQTGFNQTGIPQNTFSNNSIGQTPIGFNSQPTTSFNTMFQPQQTQQSMFPTQMNQFSSMQPTSFQQQQVQQQAPLQYQPTGLGFGNAPTEMPNVSFGGMQAQPLQNQQTGRRANLSAATPDNPFGF
ncbi:cytoskeletal protein-binding protein SLA1 ASCRUDRAFT_61747 [Ascoidea rubescens DSM 1968]|uniref:Actin cytoskeleton-regulatory complex protein SLA1 n=1 Tax=Ascoidea rubescens DSM 1968 TaxID=1344418 RepID=A0A1D2VBP8_9ASCO|nr:hypothetical protein ASCRUDRAFT_61747 [Ascoidea rubescens DSM 1968]ODV58903.1 hypothetical protein ASCRUDRAFT_61747 [Ascoidea rubescens DSM 1968]